MAYASGRVFVAALDGRLIALDARSGKIASAEREVAYEDVERLRDALQRGEERVFSVSLYVCLRSGSTSGVDDLHRRVETALGGMMASSRAALFEMLPGFLSCLPAGRDYLGRYRNLDTTSAATMSTPCKWRVRSIGI